VNLSQTELRRRVALIKAEWPGGAYRVISGCHSRKTGTEYDKKPGIKWLSCTEK
jgi:hypothetical protein